MTEWVDNPKQNPPPEGELVEVFLSNYCGDYVGEAKKLEYVKPPRKGMKKGCWRWVHKNGVRLSDQGVISWREKHD